MKTKREVLERFAEKGYCCGIDCSECAYLELCGTNKRLTIKGRLQKIGAMAILRMFKEKKKPLLKVGTKIKFENGETYVIESCIDEYREEFILRNKISEIGFPIDFLIGKTWEVVNDR